MIELLTTKQAAQMLSVTPETVRNKYRPLLKERLHYCKPTSRTLRFYREPLLNWFENRQTPEEHEKWLVQYWGELPHTDRYAVQLLGISRMPSCGLIPCR